MKHYTFGNLHRISMLQAKKLWGKVDIAMCPRNLAPGKPWNFEATYLAKQVNNLAFDKAVKQFIWYNCINNETGYKPDFYLVKKDITKP